MLCRRLSEPSNITIQTTCDVFVLFKLADSTVIFLSISKPILPLVFCIFTQDSHTTPTHEDVVPRP